MSDSVNAAGETIERPVREGVIVFAVVIVLCSLIYQLGRFVPIVGPHRGTAIALLFLYAPTWWLERKRRNFADYGLTWGSWRTASLYFVGISLAVFPPFVAAFYGYYRLICGEAGWRMLGGGLCARMQPLSLLRPNWRPRLWEFVPTQLIAVALPEEFFFRGYLQTQLEKGWPAKPWLFGAGLGRANVVASLLFAVGHVAVDFNPLRMAVFFPSLLFGWLRSATGSILASVLFHAACNILSDALHRALFAL